MHISFVKRVQFIFVYVTYWGTVETKHFLVKVRVSTQYRISVHVLLTAQALLSLSIISICCYSTHKYFLLLCSWPFVVSRLTRASYKSAHEHFLLLCSSAFLVTRSTREHFLLLESRAFPDDENFLLLKSRAVLEILFASTSCNPTHKHFLTV